MKIKLFCFPYAGGSAVVYTKWKRLLEPFVELRPIELAGRGRRMNEPLYNNLDDVIEDVYHLIKHEITNAPYALFGHSMGALIAYELAQKIKDNGLPQPLHIFFSGRSAPHVRREDEKQYHLMEDDTFKKEVMELGGTPPEFFEHAELRNIFLPLLKKDFAIAETEITTHIRPFDHDITILVGKDDDLTAEQCDGWKQHTKQICTIHYFEGGHFFLHNAMEQLTDLINKTLRACNRFILLNY